MKYLIVVFDGMADVPLPALGGKTPMMVAKTPTLDKLCPTAEVGMVLNVPQGMVPESDTANLSILSYSPLLYSKGRSPLEAVSMGLEMKDRDVTIISSYSQSSWKLCSHPELILFFFS